MTKFDWVMIGGGESITLELNDSYMFIKKEDLKKSKGLYFETKAGNDLVNLSGLDGIVRDPSLKFVVYAGGGNDTVIGSKGTDFIDGGRGKDYILAGAGDDIITSRESLDFNSHSGWEQDVIFTGGGKDKVFADRTDDIKDASGFDDVDNSIRFTAAATDSKKE